MKRFDIMCGERFHTTVTSDLRSHSMKRSDMMWGVGGGSIPQRHQTWMEEPFCEEV